MEAPMPRQISPEEAWQITCHEAGHAVVGVRLQVPFEYVERGEDEHGEVPIAVGPIENPSGNWTRDEISEWQRFYAGGAGAEQLLFGSYREYACSRDKYLHAVLEKQWQPNRRRGWEQDVQSAMKLLDRQSVEKVAKELELQRKLSDDQVYQLLGCTPWWY